MVKNLPANAGDTSSISELGRSPGGGNGNPLQYSRLENSMGEEPGGQFTGVTEFLTESTGTHTCLLHLHNLHCLRFQLLWLMNIPGWVSRVGCKREDDSYLPLLSQKSSLHEARAQNWLKEGMERAENDTQKEFTLPSRGGRVIVPGQAHLHEQQASTLLKGLLSHLKKKREREREKKILTWMDVKGLHGCLGGKSSMDFESLTLSEVSQTEKDKYCTIPILCEI